MLRLLHNRFAVRMILAFIIVTLVPTIFTSASFYIVSNRTIKSNVRESSVQIARQAAESLSFVLNVGSDMSDLINSDRKIQEMLTETDVSEEELRENEEYIKSFLNNLVYTSSFVNIVYVVKSQSENWGSGTFSKVKLSRYNVDTLDWIQYARTRDGDLVWMGLQDDRFSGGGSNTELVLPIARALKDPKTLETIGYTLINLNGKKLISNMEEMKLGQTGKFIVVDQYGKIMLDTDVQRIHSYISNRELLRNITQNEHAEFEYMDGETRYYGVKQKLSNGWLIVGTVPVHEITDKLDVLNTNILWSFIVFAFIGLLIGILLANRVTRPIKQLTSQMKLAQEGNFKVRTYTYSKDEIGLMSDQFNKMIEQIDRLLDQLTIEQQQKKDAEIRAVMHRINPHFLFNTLNTLRWLVKYNQTDKAYEGISALLRLLEANMGKKGNMIAIEEELDIIDKYLAILELRYNKKFELSYRIEEGLHRFIIPRMLLQPIVENAIFHGIVPLNIDGKIEVDVHREQEAVMITVKDNGMGILPNKRIIETSLKDGIQSGETGIGLRHVYESIQLYFGEGSDIQLLSEQNEGTTAVMKLYPKPVQGEEHGDA